MSPWLLALVASGVPTLVTKTFTAVEAWTVPYGVPRLESVTGYGARGQDSRTVTTSTYTRTQTITTFYRDGTPPDVEVKNDGVWGTGIAPSNNCNPDLLFDAPDRRSAIRQCFSYDYVTETSGPTTGAASTAFGLSFPGSTGNTAPLTTVFTNVVVTQGATYNIAVPIGGSITVTYYQ